MIQVTNTSRTSVGYVTGQKGDEPVVVAVEPDETKGVPLADDHPAIVADLMAGLITVGRPDKPKPAAKAE